MTNITRKHIGPRMTQIVTHGDTIYLSGQVGAEGESVTKQSQEALAEVDSLLAEAGSDKTRILQCIIWLADMADFAEMNAVWDAWTPEGLTPARACGEAKLATPGFKVEFTVIAAKA